MSNRRAAQDFDNWLNDLRRKEEENLPTGAFVCSVAKGYRYSNLFFAAFGIGVGSIQLLNENPDYPVTNLFFALGLFLLLMLPTTFSYRCFVDKTVIKVSYYILFLPISKEILWRDIEYKLIKNEFSGRRRSIRLYNIHKKKLISFDKTIVGFGRIIRMAKRIASVKKAV